MSSEAMRAGTPTALALAEEAHSLVQKQPRRALDVAEQARRLAALEGDEAAAVAAWHALGWAQCVLGDATTGITSLRAGVRLARRRADAQAEGLLRRLLAVWLAVDGQTRAARREMEAALNQLSGLEHARSQVHRIEVHRASGDPNPELHRRITADAARAL